MWDYLLHSWKMLKGIHTYTYKHKHEKCPVLQVFCFFCPLMNLDSLSKKQSFSFYSFHWISAAYRIKSKYFIMSYACVLSLCESMDSSPSGSSVHGILQARILEGAAISPLSGIFPTNQTCIFWGSSSSGGFFTTEPRGMPIMSYVWLQFCSPELSGMCITVSCSLFLGDVRSFSALLMPLLLARMSSTLGEGLILFSWSRLDWMSYLPSEASPDSPRHNLHFGSLSTTELPNISVLTSVHSFKNTFWSNQLENILFDHLSVEMLKPGATWLPRWLSS